MKTLSNMSILVVDDEPVVRSAIKQMLQAMGIAAVAEASNGASALLHVAAKKPDLVLCDFGMTPMSGLDFLARLRGHANTAIRPTPVVMLASSGDLNVIAKAQRLGIKGYVVKPVSPKDLRSKLDAAMREAA